MARTLSDAQRAAIFEKKSNPSSRGISMPKPVPTTIKAPKAPSLGGVSGTNPGRFGNPGTPPSKPSATGKFGMPAMPQKPTMTPSGVAGVPKLSTANRKSVSRMGW